MARRKKQIDQGDAISMEDALSMLVVIFVLFVVFLVPLVSMDKPPKLKKVPEDPFWAKVSRSLEGLHPTANKYAPNFGIYNFLASRVIQRENTKVIEFLAQDSSVTIIEHQVENNQFVSIYIPIGGSSIIYKTGELEFDPIEEEWALVQSNTHYFPNASTETTEYNYKKWFRLSTP